ncbi:MAG: cysteine desulfurase [Phycisphaerae bacterium]|nr:cysteine desulfurase [Phycisphaerae bacterium]MCZ2401061.1 cysteine desulfurase [Phycisphaerae bacterium]NUQ50047.1 cysteine desulfurase [Phycisphaerae bacterium]
MDVERIRRDFPILATQVRGKPLVYLDNAATAQKPRAVIDAISAYYESDNANIHRGVHALSIRATEAYEAARRRIQALINAEAPEQVIFVRGATEGVNLVAQSYGRPRLRPGDEILITEMEHHSNIVPWQLLCEQTGAGLRVAPINDRGELRLDEFERLLSERTKIAAFAHVSNALGTVNPVRELAGLAHRAGAVVLVDGAQATPHQAVDVRQLGCDFYVFSGHKMFGPTGVGVLYGRRELLEALPPYQGGGEMILSVTFEKTVYAALPARLEAGTPHIAGGIGLGAAVAYLSQIGYDAIAAHEAALLEHGTRVLGEIPQVRLIGTAAHKASVLSFVIDGVHAHDAGTVLDQLGIAIRTGHHCAQPVMQHFGVPATCRASLAFYNTTEELDVLAAGVRKVCEVFGV